jgi:hypothetical protein
MTLGELLRKTSAVQLPPDPLPAEQASAALLLPLLAPEAELHTGVHPAATVGTLQLSARGHNGLGQAVTADTPEDRHWAHVRLASNGSGHLVASHPALLYAYAATLGDRWRDQPATDVAEGRLHTTAFLCHRPLSDALLTQVWRTARHFDPEEHIRELARSGFTHIEVNALATPVPLEDWVPGEFYSSFYSRCAALDQFVYSELNRGIYPVEYLAANLNLLKRYAALGRRYGLQPGMICWEPRSVPERLLSKYPTLRGARVDHPFRSRLPRYALTLSHPLVQEHYRELVHKLLTAVPDLAYLSVRTNDSGAGFEHSNSLYAGRNGGAFLIREWHSHEDIATAAGANAAHFLEILQTAATETNPDFRVTIGLGGLDEERPSILAGLPQGVEIEVGSTPEADLEGRTTHTSYTQGATTYQPLLGVPSPWIVAERLQEVIDSGASHVGNGGGTVPRRLVPYNVNQQVSTALVLDPETKVEELVSRCAREWAGFRAASLEEVWRLIDRALRALPRLPLYSEFGFVWYRLWVRPLVLDLQAVPDKSRRYYEDFLVSPDNNTNLVDLGRDVLFDLFTREYARDYVQRVDADVSPVLRAAVSLAATQASDDGVPENVRAVFIDQRDRLQGLSCWVGTLRAVAAWVAGVYGYLATDDPQCQRREREYLDDMISKEITCAAELLHLWEHSSTEFMVVSQVGETSYIYGENFGELLAEKIRLMERYRHADPRIDSEILWKV